MTTRPFDEAAANEVREWCQDSEVEFSEDSPGRFAIVLPGEHKLRTTVSVSVGMHQVNVQAFVMRCPDQDSEEINTWLLERNRRIFGLGYALDHHGDIFLVGSLPPNCMDAETVDRLMGAVLEHADQPFNRLLEMGFSDAIRAEWRWRLGAGESTANLAAFGHLAPAGTPNQRSDDPERT